MSKYEKKVFDRWINCIPPRTTKQHARVVRDKSGQVRAFQPAKVKQAEDTILGLFLPYAPSEPFTGPLKIELILVYPWRKGESKKNRQSRRRWKDTRPDLDNSGKLIIDAIAPKFFIDDAQICSLDFQKFWGDTSGIGLKIYQLSQY
ncbi:MAG: RusA family crossover junction endodeoxyribonuclease [Planctomycetes bacterium]|nr:RusA family crossover junction endodeoxyribonuclease [Planctomycetota bacterium]